MKTQAKFLQLQKNWIGRTVLERKQELKVAEINEDYDKCIEIKDSLDKGLEIAQTSLKISEDIFNNPFTYPRLIFGLFSVWDELTNSITRADGRLTDINGAADGLQIAFKGHVYNTIRFSKFDPETGEETGLREDLDIKHPQYANCGSIEGNDIYIIEKVCECKHEGATLHEITDHIMMSILNELEEQEKDPKRRKKLKAIQ